ncbi:hypothetical protein ES705_31787 [subsurface metagenome]
MRLSIVFIGHESREFLESQRAYRETFSGNGITIDVRSIKGGPETMECEKDEVEAGPWIIQEAIDAEKSGSDALMIDCAADPCLHALREVLSINVIGPGLAAFSQAAALKECFSVIAPLPTLVPVYRRKIREYGLESKLASVRSISYPIMDLLSKSALESFVKEGMRAIHEDGAETLVIGCTGLSPGFSFLRQELPVPVIDPVSAGIHLAASSAGF